MCICDLHKEDLDAAVNAAVRLDKILQKGKINISEEAVEEIILGCVQLLKMLTSNQHEVGRDISINSCIRVQEVPCHQLHLWTLRKSTCSKLWCFTVEKELLAIVWGCKYFRQYLYGRRFTIVTDHRPKTWIFSVKDPSSRLKLEEHDYEVIDKEV
ncbi:Retrovirus-related Pol polyprotein from transposon 17.6 [Zootermopsis nevadensis]|uniref:Retrovirus-related Pol polyprotein from transposon 17.6 n=1 Tax=Zootermopsis nevadensis TaxID=136037 RepID=A0A067R399_ZOONE|nr:Retrovirus-related Pol polyprotein from transposon 17.6 [Zootermopsis nevadensis]